MSVIYKWIASILAVIAVVGLIYAKGHSEAEAKAELRATQLELSQLYYDIAKEREARVADARLAEEAAQKAADLKSKVTSLQEYADALKDANAQCLSSSDTQRVRDLWN
ncbi:hypothetical protein [Brucella sp. 2716]|uniref:hypothetical protein n=1 Tax=Brucella sp. 2716 TaxID=2975052 RepID=UPI00217D89F3|nr:hypothetical protein [Brucella sp. 2716]UWF59805.1 hypothetical protein NYO66_04650 [Brucella sp. 2716]